MPRPNNKPIWKRTATSWDTEIMIWERMALGDSNNQVSVWLDQQEKENSTKRMSLDLRTIKLVRKELSLLPEYLATKLPQVIYSYWLSLRKELVVPTMTVEGTYDVLPELPKVNQPLMLGIGETKANDIDKAIKQPLSLNPGSTSEKNKTIYGWNW